MKIIEVSCNPEEVEAVVDEIRDIPSESLDVRAVEVNTVLMDIQRERDRQDKKWGVRDQPSFCQQFDLHTGALIGPIPLPARFTYYGIPTEEDARKDCENTMKRGKANWGHILVEEVSEAFGSTTEEELEKELIQVAAVATAWVENIRRRRASR